LTPDIAPAFAKATAGKPLNPGYGYDYAALAFPGASFRLR